MPTNNALSAAHQDIVSLDPTQLGQFVSQCLKAAGASGKCATEARRALLGASLRGTDSHGVRLLPHYCKALAGGRVKGHPQTRFEKTADAAGLVDADHGLGHRATYVAVEQGVELARTTGVAYVGVVNSSHFGAAGSYAIEIAEQGCVGMVVCNSDSFVLPQGGTQPFHGTNPIAFSAPSRGHRPFMLDMATSAIPWNRVQQFAGSGRSLPRDTAVDDLGQETRVPEQAAALLPLGGLMFGHKGSGLAAMVDVMSALITGMPYSAQILPMIGDDFSTPRKLSHGVFVMRRDLFIPADQFDIAMEDYLNAFSAARAQPGERVLYPGEKEWNTETQRREAGIPFTPDQIEDFEKLAKLFGLQMPGQVAA